MAVTPPKPTRGEETRCELGEDGEVLLLVEQEEFNATTFNGDPLFPSIPKLISFSNDQKYGWENYG